jgi:hypothetical protein
MKRSPALRSSPGIEDREGFYLFFTQTIFTLRKNVYNENCKLGFPVFMKGDKKMTLTKKIVAVVLAAVLALSCLAACGTTASVVNRNPESNRGTSIHNGF